MKKVISLSLVLVMLLALCACGATNETTAEETKPAASSAAEEAAAETSTKEEAPKNVMTLTFSTNTNDNATETKFIKEWIEKVEELSGGSVKFDLYLSGALVSESDCIDAVKSGLCDVAFVSWGKQANNLPLSSCLLAPFATPGDGRTFYQNVFKPLWEQFPELQEEYDGTVVVAFGMNTYGAGLHANSPIRLPADAKGLLIAAQSASQSDLTVKAGASPLTLEASEWYSSLERGICDGLWMTWGAMVGLNLYEVCSNSTIFPSGYDRPVTCFLMNEGVFNKLPADVQEQITSDEFMAWCSDRWASYDEENFATVEKVLKDAGNEVIYLTEEEENEWIELASDVRAAYIQGIEDKGLPANDFYAAYEALAADNQ